MPYQSRQESVEDLAKIDNLFRQYSLACRQQDVRAFSKRIPLRMEGGFFDWSWSLVLPERYYEALKYKFELGYMEEGHFCCFPMNVLIGSEDRAYILAGKRLYHTLIEEARINEAKIQRDSETVLPQEEI
jgi:hypothetical protein